MAIALRAAGAWASTTASSVTPVIPAAQVTGDLMLLIFTGKPFDLNIIEPGNGWTSLGGAASGSTNAGVDVGSMWIQAYYKIAESDTETNPTIGESGNSFNVVTAAVCVFSKAAGDTWETPVAVYGGDETTGTSISVTFASNPGGKAGDYVLLACGINTDAMGPLTTDLTPSWTGITFGSADPGIEGEGTTGGDMAAHYMSRPVSSGTASAAPTCTGTGTATGGSDKLEAVFIRLRVSGVSEADANATGTSTSAADSGATKNTDANTDATSATNIIGVGFNETEASATGTSTAQADGEDIQVVTVIIEAVALSVGPVDRFAGNPIINYGGGGWKDSQVQEPIVVFDQSDSSKLIMLFAGMSAPKASGTQSVALATALVSDPYSWTEAPDNPYIGDTNWQNHRLDAVIPLGGSSWYFYLTAPGNNCIDLYYSTDLTYATAAAGTATWVRSGVILSPSGDETIVCQAAVLKDGSDWYMVYAYRTASAALPGLRLATSSDGVNWNKVAGDLIHIEGTPGPGAPPDSHYIEWHQLLKLGNKFVLLYEGYNGEDTAPHDWAVWTVNIAVADSMAGPWVKSSRNPVFTGNNVIAPDRWHVATPALYQIGGTWYLFYQAGNTDPALDFYYNNNWSLCMGKLPGVPLDLFCAVFAAVILGSDASSDGTSSASADGEAVVQVYSEADGSAVGTSSTNIVGCLIYGAEFTTPCTTTTTVDGLAIWAVSETVAGTSATTFNSGAIKGSSWSVACDSTATINGGAIWTEFASATGTSIAAAESLTRARLETDGSAIGISATDFVSGKTALCDGVATGTSTASADYENAASPIREVDGTSVGTSTAAADSLTRVRIAVDGSAAGSASADANTGATKGADASTTATSMASGDLAALWHVSASAAGSVTLVGNSGAIVGVVGAAIGTCGVVGQITDAAAGSDATAVGTSTAQAQSRVTAGVTATAVGSSTVSGQTACRVGTSYAITGAAVATGQALAVTIVSCDGAVACAVVVNGQVAFIILARATTTGSGVAQAEAIIVHNATLNVQLGALGTAIAVGVAVTANLDAVLPACIAKMYVMPQVSVHSLVAGVLAVTSASGTLQAVPHHATLEAVK